MRSAVHPRRLTAATFPEAANDSLYLLVRVEPGLPRLHRGVARFLDHQYPGLFGFGTLASREVRRAGWWEVHFRNAVGPMKGSRTGYFLLHEGQVIGHHSGMVRADLHYTDGSESVEDRQRGDAEVQWVREVAFGNGPVTTRELAAAIELIAYFDGLVMQRQGRSGFGKDGRSTASGTGVSIGGVTAQTVPIPGESGDPFVVLKVGVEADADQIRAAYKEAMKRNHPDKVAHMSEEIRAYAEAQVRVIKAAYDALKGAGKG